MDIVKNRLPAVCSSDMRANALILDVTHRCLLVDGGLPAIEVAAGRRPLAALQEELARELGIELSVPLGRREGGDEVWFVFLVAAPPAASSRFVPLRRWALHAALAPAWALYVDAMLGGWEPPTRELEVFFFGDTPTLAAKLAHMVVKGEKRGTTGWVAAAEREGWTIPHVGLVSIVTDFHGIPLCAIRTERLERGRFADAGEEIARAEGEGDRSFADWRDSHRWYFEGEAARLGLSFDDDAILIYEHFSVVRVLRREP